VVSLCRNSARVRHFAGEPADHDGEAEVELGGALPLSVPREQAGQRRALAEAEDPVEPGTGADQVDAQSRVRFQPSKPSCHQPKSPVASEGALT